VRVDATFLDEAGAATDPTTITFQAGPSGAAPVADYTWSSGTPGTDILATAPGVFHTYVTVTTPGQWVYRMTSTGAVQQAAQGGFLVRGSVYP
jgi:hypothetical protein